jgi:hypothetical protein
MPAARLSGKFVCFTRPWTIQLGQQITLVCIMVCKALYFGLDTATSIGIYAKRGWGFKRSSVREAQLRVVIK